MNLIKILTLFDGFVDGPPKQNKRSYTPNSFQNYFASFLREIHASAIDEELSRNLLFGEMLNPSNWCTKNFWFKISLICIK